MIALWTTGPAYLATFHDILEDEELNPYLDGRPSGLAAHPAAIVQDPVEPFEGVYLVPIIPIAKQPAVVEEKCFVEVGRTAGVPKLGGGRLEKV